MGVLGNGLDDNDYVSIKFNINITEMKMNYDHKRILIQIHLKIQISSEFNLKCENIFCLDPKTFTNVNFVKKIE